MDQFDGLTEEQRTAVLLRIEQQKTRYFSGVSIEELISIFRSINAARARGAPKVAEREDRWFEICGHKRKPPE